MKPEIIIRQEEKEGMFSGMGMGTFEKDLEKYFKDKKVKVVYSEITNSAGKLTWWEIVYETVQKFYIHVTHTKVDGDKWNMNIYYKPEQMNELILYTNQLLKQLK